MAASQPSLTRLWRCLCSTLVLQNDLIIRLVWNNPPGSCFSGCSGFSFSFLLVWDFCGNSSSLGAIISRVWQREGRAQCFSSSDVSPARMAAEVFMFAEATESFWVSTGSPNRSKCCFVRRDSGRSHSGDRTAQEVLISVQGSVSLPCTIALIWEASVLGLSALPGGWGTSKARLQTAITLYLHPKWRRQTEKQQQRRLVWFLLETGSHYEALAGLELDIYAG